MTHLWRLRQKVAVIAVVVLIWGACSHRSETASLRTATTPTVLEPTTTTVYDPAGPGPAYLVAGHTPQERPGFPDPPISQISAVRPCAEVEALAGLPLRVLSPPPPKASKAICYVEAPDAGGSLSKPSTGYWAVGVMYVPDFLNPNATGRTAAITEYGAVDVEMIFNQKQVAVNPAAVREVDGYVAVDINGYLGGITRPTEKLITVKWSEGPLELYMAGSYPPQAMVRFARSLTPNIVIPMPFTTPSSPPTTAVAPGQGS
jgi:hypothetical protein